MPNIRNLALIKRFTEYFRLKANDMLDSEAGRMLVPVVNLPLPANIKAIIDTATNDSDKTFTVPSGKQWKFLYGFIDFTTTATVGDRQIIILITDGTGNIWRIEALNVQAASLTERYNMQSGGTSVTEDVALTHVIPLPSIAILGSGFTIRILDSAAVDPAADDMLIRLVVEERDLEDL